MRALRGEALQKLIPTLLLLCMAQSCGTLDVPLKPPQFQPADFFSARRDGIEVLAKPIVGVDNYLDLFDDNLPEIGIAAVWVMVRDVGAGDITLEKSRWDLRVGGGEHSSLSVNQVFETYYKRRGIRLYSQHSDERGRADLEKLMLKSAPVRSRQERAGFVFFRITPVLSAEWAHGAVLSLRNLRIANHQKADIEVSLSHANP